MRFNSSRGVCRWVGCVLLGLFWVGMDSPCEAQQLYVGRARVNITPERPVALAGQMRTRIARKAETPIIASALVLETRREQESVEQAVFVTCDLVAIRDGIPEEVTAKLKDRAEGLESPKIILNATHTHTAPVVRSGQYQIPEDAWQPEEYRDWLTDQLADCIVAAWEDRQPAQAGWGLGYAVTAYNRRAVYADGSARMYGATNIPEFRGIEGPEDQGIEILYFWDMDDKLIATAINVASPSQIVEGLSVIHADFWHYVRQSLWQQHGEDLLVLSWTGAAGDQVPRSMFRKQAEERMRKLKGVSQLEDIASRVVHAWEETLQGAVHEKHREPAFRHNIRTVSLTPRKISEQEYQSSLAGVKANQDNPDAWRRMWHQRVVDRYELQQAGELPNYEMTLHTLRLGEIAIATNVFEYFTDFGVQIKARSPALQTFLIQLAGPGTYVPTQKAVDGGSYSAIAESNLVGPEGGQELAEKTLEAIQELWE